MFGRTSPDIGRHHAQAVADAVAHTGCPYTCTITDSVADARYTYAHPVSDAIADTRYINFCSGLNRLVDLGQTWAATL